MTVSLPHHVLGFLNRVLPAVERDYLIGDLEEQYLDHAIQRYGRPRAILWLWRRVLSLTGAYLWSLIRYGKTREVDVNLAADRYRRQSSSDDRNGDRNGPFDRLKENLKYSLRRVRHQPTFSAIIVLTLALGIGANVTIFSLVNALLLRPLDYPDSRELVALNHYYPETGLLSSVSARGFSEYRDTMSSFERVAASRGWVTNLTGLGDPERLVGNRISWDYFDVYGVEPAIGRTFLEEEDLFGNSKVVILSDGFWQSAGAPDILGQTIQLNGESYEIVGVMPEGFRDFMLQSTLLWTPLAETPARLNNPSIIWEYLSVVARLDEGVTLEMARAEMAAKSEIMYTEIEQLIPGGWMCRVTGLNEMARQGFRSSLLLLFAAVGIVLLLTCSNVANMLLARSIRRRKEVAIRSAIGAGRSRLVGMLLTESVVLAGLGGIAGFFLAWGGVRAIIAFGPAQFGMIDISIDLTVLLFTIGLSVVTGVLFGLAPATQASRLDIQGTLREGGLGSQVERSGGRLRQVLVAAEFAMALIVLAGAGLLIRSMDGLQRIDPGFDPENLLTVGLSLPTAKYQDNASVSAFWDELLDRLNETPGIVSAAYTSQIPFTGRGFTTIFNVDGYVTDDDHPRPWGQVRTISPRYFETLGLPLVEGRVFEAGDSPESLPVIIVDEVAVERLWPDTDPLSGRAFGQPSDLENNPWFHVAGVVGHAHQEGLVEDTQLQVYLSYHQNPNSGGNLIIRTTGDPLTMVPTVRSTVLSIDPDQPIARINTMDDMIMTSIGDRRTTMVLLVIFAGLAVFLAALGIYGVMTEMVGEKTREIGIRMACGAGRTDLIRMVLKHGMLLAISGTFIGLIAALFLTSLIRSQLYEISPTDPLTLGSVTILIILIGGISTFLPALRAARMDPVTCMRRE
ncbi:ABC transporter permease [Gemmatimonadota bacterium]